MNSIDKAFFALADEIRSLDEKELYTACAGASTPSRSLPSAG